MHLSFQIEPVIFFSDPNKLVLGPVDVFGPFLTYFAFFSGFLLGDCTNPGNKKMISIGRWVGGALALRAQRQPYRALYNPYRALYRALWGPILGPVLLFGPSAW